MSLILGNSDPHVYRPRFLPSRCKPLVYRCPRWLWIVTCIALGIIGALLTLTVSRAIDFALWVNR